MRINNKKTQALLITVCLLLGTHAFCEKDMYLKLLWQSPMLKDNPICFFDPQQKTVRYFTDGKISVVNGKGEMIYVKALETIIGRDRKDSIYFFAKGKASPEIERLHGWKVDLARFTHFSRSLNCFAQFTLYKNGKLFLEMFKWDSGKSDYVRKWQSDIPSDLLETIASDQRLPIVEVSDQGWLAMKSNQGDYCELVEHQDTVWIYDTRGMLTKKFFAGDEHFYECDKYDDVTNIRRGIIQSITFSEDGTRLLIQGRSKENVDDQVFLVVDENGTIL